MSALRGYGLDGRAALSVETGSDLALAADVRDVRDEQDRESAGVVPARLETSAIAGGSVCEAINRVEQPLTARHSRNAMSRSGRKGAA